MLAIGLACSLKKIGKVTRIIVIGYRTSRRLGLLLLPRSAGDLPGLAVGVPCEARPPAFAGVTGGVAVGLQQLDPAAKLGRENRHVVAGILQLPRIATGQDDRAGWRALGVRSVGTLKQNTLLGQAIKVGCAHPVASVHASMAKRPVVGDGEKNVRPVRRLAKRRQAGTQ